MKIQALAKLATESNTIFLADGMGGRQWVSIDGATYPMDGMPPMNEMQLLTVLGIPEEDRKLYDVKRCIAPEDTTEDNLDEDAEAELINMTLTANGHTWRPLYTPHGMVCIDDDHRKPVADSRKTYQFYARKLGEKITIVIKNGFKLIAVIPPRKAWAEDKVCDWLCDLREHAGRANSDYHKELPEDGRYTGTYL